MLANGAIVMWCVVVRQRPISQNYGDENTRVPPWYPIVKLPVNLVRSVAAVARRGGVDRVAARGAREQKALLHTIIGDREATIGESAAHVDRVA
jgi:hypothetical protein